MMNIKYGLVSALFLTTISEIAAQHSYWNRLEDKESTLGIAEVYQKFNTPNFQLKLVKASQTVAALRPNEELSFDFTQLPPNFI